MLIKNNKPNIGRGDLLTGDCAQVLHDSDLVATLKVQLTEDESLPEIICNVFTLIKALAVSGKEMLLS